MTPREQAFLTTPRGRFLEAVAALDDGAGYRVEANNCLMLYRECLGHGRLDLIAVAKIIKLLSPINVRDARAAIEALADMVLEEAQ